MSQISVNHEKMQISTIGNNISKSSKIISLAQRRVSHAIDHIIPTKIALPTTEGIQYVRFNHISHCIADNNYCSVILKSGEIIFLSKTLKWVAERLPSQEFLRTHAAYLVNADCVSRFCNYHLFLDNGDEIPVSRARKNDLINELNRRCLK